MSKIKRQNSIKFIKESRHNKVDEINYKSLAAAGLLGLSSFSEPLQSAEPPAKVDQIKYPYTVYDVIAATLVDEAGGEKDYENGMIGVMNVLMKRGNGDIRKAAEACLKPKQFSGWNNVNKSNIDGINKFIESKRKHSRFSLALKIVDQARKGNLKDITKGADHFLNIDLTKVQSSKLPAWFDAKKITVKVGNHTFLKLS
jgi:hypothetical protein